MRPQLLAVRAINQYRRRDVLAYLGLRYYLESTCARSDLWAREVSTHLANTRPSPVYFRSYQFKEMDEEGSVICRDIYVPGPNEALAESALLYECSLHPAFRSLPCVYSYRFPHRDSKEGIFQYYFPGFRERHSSIAKVCKELREEAVVQYTDIVKFYPNISKDLALRTWQSTCDSSDISSMSRCLGERLLMDHKEVATAHDAGLGVLTGPMFSHLIANLILAKVDMTMSEKTGGRYWRYVDDIVLAGDAPQVDAAQELLESLLADNDMGFRLHKDGKELRVSSFEWLEGASDFDDSESKAWIGLIADVKRFLITRPDERAFLARVFSENGINIPLPDYSAAVAEPSYLESLLDWLSRYPWAPKSIRTLSVTALLEDALKARDIYENRMKQLLDRGLPTQGYRRKRLIPKLRFYAGRLVYLSTPAVLSSIGAALASCPELLLWSRVMNAIRSRDVSSLLQFGANAVQAAAQVLRIQNEPVQCSLSSFEEVELQGLAILRLNGIDVALTRETIDATIGDPLNQFALGHNPLHLMKSDDLFIQEIACLRGVENPLRHQSFMDVAFDRDEHLALDILRRLHDSSYF